MAILPPDVPAAARRTLACFTHGNCGRLERWTTRQQQEAGSMNLVNSFPYGGINVPHMACNVATIDAYNRVKMEHAPCSPSWGNVNTNSSSNNNNNNSTNNNNNINKLIVSETGSRSVASSLPLSGLDTTSEKRPGEMTSFASRVGFPFPEMANSVTEIVGNDARKNFSPSFQRSENVVYNLPSPPYMNSRKQATLRQPVYSPPVPNSECAEKITSKVFVPAGELMTRVKLLYILQVVIYIFF